jgi:hypothetical protein
MIRADIELARYAAQDVFKIAYELLEARRQMDLTARDVAVGRLPREHLLAARECVDSYREALRIAKEALDRQLKEIA